MPGLQRWLQRLQQQPQLVLLTCACACHWKLITLPHFHEPCFRHVLTAPAGFCMYIFVSQLLARASNRRKSRNALAAEVAAAAAAAANSDGEKEAELVDLLGGGGGGGGSSRAGQGRKVRDELHQACT